MLPANGSSDRARWQEEDKDEKGKGEEEDEQAQHPIAEEATV
jgi:hypothetical protein